MANPEHLKTVQGGVREILKWRSHHPNESLDLEGADLRGAELSSADLTGANLIRATLEDAHLDGALLKNALLYEVDLAGADLHGANLQSIETSGAILSRTNLRSADLGGASLFDSSLVRTDLHGADLSFAQLSGLDVRDVDFEDAIFWETTLSDTDLSVARGLERATHQGPSAIDEQTLRRSWPLPEVFLRGCGLSEELIGFARATYGRAIEFYSCFISYSSKDEEFAKRLHADLQAEGVRCWFAPEDLRIGDKFRARIDEAIRLHDKLLLILSEDSVNSTWVEDEVESALEKERKAKERGEERTVLFPIRLDSAVMETDAAWAASIRRTRHIGDFSAWKDHDKYQNAFGRLLRDLKAGAKQTLED